MGGDGRGDAKRLVAELLRTAREPGTGRALPAGCYVDPAFFELEREHFLRPGWHAVARWDDLPEPGDYRAVEIAGEAVIVVRGADGALRAFSGVCLHRAFPIAHGEGNARRFVCPYHRWTYDLDGRLRAAPLMDDVPGFDRDACRLPELPLEQWQGFVLVSVDPNAAPLGPRLAELSDLLAPLALDRSVHVGASDWDSPWNWKVMVENFMESYHHLGPHADNFGRTHPARGTHALEVGGPCAVLENPPAEGAGDPFWVIQVFPTLLLAAFRGEVPVLSWYEMQIDRVDHFHLRIHAMLPGPLAGNRELCEAIAESVRTVHLQDITACQGVQRGVHSRLWRPGPLSVHEAALRAFHRHLAERISAGVSESG